MSRFFQKAIYLSAALGLQAGTSSAQDIKAFTVHEWGTFTSMQGSDGKNQEGMHHEEEALPSFVRGRCGSGTVHGDAKCADFQPEAGTPRAVTQKMETPVIYFYGGEGQTAVVNVGFPRGIISQWYPDAAGFTPRIHDVPAVTGGSMTWNTLIKAPDTALTHSVPDGNQWNYARDVDANAVTIAGATEKFIFYRGLGRFDTDLRVTTDAGGIFKIENHSPDLVPAVFLLNFDGENGYTIPVGSVTSKMPRTFKATPKAVLKRDAYLRQAQSLVRDALVASGLYPKEAQGMVKTWEKSYFLTPGLRVLYVLPRTWTDRLLPLSIQPEPKETVRTLVGRIEVMTKAEENSTVEALNAAVAGGPAFDLAPWGRLQESKLRRILSLNPSAQVTEAIQKKLDNEFCTAIPCK